MNYPEHIYSKFEILEKEIYGEKHYCAVKVYGWGWFKIKRKMKVYWYSSSRAWFCNHSGVTWHKYKSIIENAINSAHQDAEDKFHYKVTK